MTIHNIKYSLNKSIDGSFINALLTKNIFNDYYFEKAYFEITADIDLYQDFLYRLLWETVYLRRNYNERSYYNKDDNSCVLMISVSECIAFLKSAIPQNYHISMEEAIGSINKIGSTMELLLKDNSLQSYYASIFKKILHLEIYGTNKTYDIKRMDTVKDSISEENKKKIIVDVEAFSGDYFETELNNLNFDMALTLNTHSDKQNGLLLKYGVFDSYSLSNLYKIKNELYLNLCYEHKPNGFINKIIKRVYRVGP